jgi:hypothetical protein
VRFFSATFGAGVIATQCPITRTKRRILPGRYASFLPKFLKNRVNFYKNNDKNVLKKGKISVYLKGTLKIGGNSWKLQQNS